MNKVKGVSRDTRGDRWQVRARAEKRTIHLGYYRDWFDAVCARKAFEAGHFKKTNLRKQPNRKVKKWTRKPFESQAKPDPLERFYRGLR